ncbi:MAG: UPF0280 family protein [Burkholderiaceae bacterium]|nr:UPF0280 family protein [Burkholderiaceae bacterium]
MNGAQRSRLGDGRWHFQHGPIDIVIGADGDAAAVQAGHDAAWSRFQPVLGELVAELPLLRRPVAPQGGANPLRGEVARRMWEACAPLLAEADGFITPMAAVAGAVAQTLVACYQRPGIRRAWINNGGDIALHLAPGESLRVGLYADLANFDAAALARAATGTLRTDAGFVLRSSDPVRGVATSGWRGRSLSRGIADSVTVLAATAAMADAAATVIANAVDVADPAVERRSANQVRDDSDLGELLVTVAVGPLAPERVQQALQRGEAMARRLQSRGRVHAALLACQGSLARVEALPALESVQ